MNVSCVRQIGNIKHGYTDLILFPEGASLGVLHKAASKYPNAIVVGAVEINKSSVGLLFHRNQEKIIYFKVTSDGRTKGSGDISQWPMYEDKNVCVGVLVCMDVNHVEFSNKVISKIRSSDCDKRIICVPADMGSDWFSNSNIGAKYKGVNVVLCNSDRTHKPGCQHFVTLTNGEKQIEAPDILYTALPSQPEQANAADT